GFITELPKISKFTSVAIGPGIGIKQETASLFKLLIQEAKTPLVIDADAINILAEHPTWLAYLPKGSILTPHPGEFARLVGEKSSHCENIERQKEFSIRFGIYILLKGGHSTLSLPDGQILVNDSGNPGMASAGMGDVLTGIIAGLLASGYSSMEAGALGTFVHGLAADLALEEQSYESLIATDVLAYLGRAFKILENEI
ncbi:MAG: NAD(P)H-hydrate dehydratase, partial [Bacteroidota bacterium]